MSCTVKRGFVTVLAGTVILLCGGAVSCCWSADKSEETTDIYGLLHQFHGHTCGGSLMGARLGLAAKAALERIGIEGRLKAQYFDLSCPVDGIQVTVGTTYGNGAISVQDSGEHRLILTDEKSGHQVEARLTERATEQAMTSRELLKKARALPVDSPARKELEQEVEAIFAWFRTAPESEVVVVKIIRE